jgi:tetratricopeptide (TPR) repeat protein
METRGPLLKERIANWLALTRAVDAQVGLTEEEARAKAQALLAAIRNASGAPERTSVDEDVKQVLSVLVSMLRTSEGSPESRLKEADSVYKFIDRLSWPEDPFGEKRDLLIECAEIGWGAEGRSIDAETSARLRLMSDREPSPAPSTVCCATVDREASLAQGDLEANMANESWLEGRTPEILHRACQRLSRSVGAQPAVTIDEAFRLFTWLSDSATSGPPFDEKDQLCGELALLLGRGYRLIGQLTTAQEWLQKARKHFRQTLSPVPMVLQVDCEQLIVDCDAKKYEQAFSRAETLARDCVRLGLRREWLRCQLVAAECAKCLGHTRKARERLEGLRDELDLKEHPTLLASTLVKLANALALEDRYEEGTAVQAEALRVLSYIDAPMLRAEVKIVMAEGLRDRGLWEEAVALYRAGVQEYVDVGMSNFAAYARIILAESLLARNRYREAEQEILAALPTIEEQKMIPEGFAAVALLKESVRRRKTDPNALRELREHLQAAGQK